MTHTTNKKRYSQLRDALREWCEIAAETQRRASLQQNVIRGGIDLSDDRAEQERLRKLCLRLTREIIENGGRLSHLLEIHDEYAWNDWGGRELVKEAMRGY